MKKNKQLKRKIAGVLCGAILPVSAAGIMFSLDNAQTAKAATGSNASYVKSYVKELSLTNNNFNSSSSSYSLSTSLSGWTGQNNDGKTTAGIINTGSNFQSYFDSTYHLSNNPLSKATDKYILMINSKTQSSSDTTNLYRTAKQGYKSSDVTLEANSYYSFQVSFKSDTNYKTIKSYNKSGEIAASTTISKSTFLGSESNPTKFGDYISFTYRNKQYFLLKELQASDILSSQENVETFYDDGEYLGVLIENGDNKSACFVSAENVTESTEANKVNIKDNTQAYTCKNITYVPNGSNGNYTVAEKTDYFEQINDYEPISSATFGSIYLSGLKDENGDDVKAEYVQISSKEWTDFHFFIATGNESQTVNLQLWLGSKNTEASGVVFYDDCHVMQYSENAFWNTYKNYFGKTYIKDVTNPDGTVESAHDSCVNLTDLRKDSSLDFSDYNFDFEEGIYHDDITSLKNWKKSEQDNGYARIFDVNNKEYFKSTTGYDFVGSNLSCTVTLNDKKVELLKENKYVLGLWAKEGNVKVTSDEIEIASNEIYKIKAYYKISELSNGSAYMFVEENDNVLSSYKLNDTQYSLSSEVSSSAISTNASNDFINNYGVIEFYVKGGALYNSSVNLSLGLGKSDETATGCVVFDNITIEKASSEAFSAASNKLELGTSSLTPTISNGNFNNVNILNNSTRPYSPENWTITKGNGTTFGGVINTDEKQYEEYVKLYQQKADEGATFENNPYYWASWANPKNSHNTLDPDNILMLANISKSWQKVQSDRISLNADTTYKLSFDFKTSALRTVQGFNLTIFDDSGFKLYEAKNISSNDWKNFEVYLKCFSNASQIYLEIELDTTEAEVCNFAYFDNFTLKSGVSVPETDNVVDMTDFYLNLPTNNISNGETEAFTSTGNAQIVKSERFNQNDKFAIYTDEFKTEIDKNKNVFFLSSPTQGTQTLESKFNIDLKSGTYYTLTFKLKTYFEDNNTDKEKTYSYGATVGLTGFDYATHLKSADEYSTYTLHFHATEDSSSKLYISLDCNADKISGSMALYDLTFEQSTEDDFNAAKATTEEGGYDINDDKVFVAIKSDSEPDTPDDSDTDNSPSNSQGFNWLLIPSLIFGLAIIIAVVGYFLRKIKIKKIETKKRESYDRKKSLNVDAIKLRARKEQEANIAQVQNTIDKFEKELENLEREHKQKVVSLRENDKGAVSKATDKEFKRFAQKRTVIAEKIESLKKQIEEMKSAEYLLNLERKIFAKDEMKQRELAKASKKQNKSTDKAMKAVSETKSKNSK